MNIAMEFISSLFRKRIKQYKLKKLHLLLIIISFVGSLAYSQSLNNGGFEDSLNFSTPRLTNSGNAVFGIVSDDPKEGAFALKIMVTSVGSNNTAVSVVSSQLDMNAGELYLVRFWARSNSENALMRLEIKDNDYMEYIDYKVRDGWYQYQYAFKAGSPQATIEFSFETFTTYTIDGIELIGESDEKTTDIAMTHIWQNHLGEWGWISGDNDPSVLLPDGRIAWIFNDSWLGTPNPHSNSLDVRGMYHNMIVLQEGENTDLRTIYGGTQQNPSPLLVPRTSGTKYWIGDGIVEDNKLKVLLQNWGTGSDGWPEFNGKAAVALLSLEDMSEDTIIELSYNRSDIPNCILEGDGDYNYIYTVERIAHFEWYARVARVPKGEFESTEEWEFYTDNDVWASGDITPKRIATIEPGSVIKLGPDNYAMLGSPQLSNRLELWFSTAPEGPWGNKTTVYKIPEEPSIYAYLPHIHEETESNGVYTLSYSVNTFDGIGHQIADKGTYIPYYVKVDILNASKGLLPAILTPYIVYKGTVKERSGIAVLKGDYLSLKPQSTIENGTWSWTGPSGFSSNSQRVDLFNIQVEEGGRYTATFTDAHNNTNSLTINVIVTEVETTSVADVQAQEALLVYPNPVSDLLYIQGVEQNEIFSMELFNVTGKKVLQSEKSEIDMHPFDEGVYFLRVQCGAVMFNRMVIKRD